MTPEEKSGVYTLYMIRKSIEYYKAKHPEGSEPFVIMPTRLYYDLIDGCGVLKSDKSCYWIYGCRIAYCDSLKNNEVVIR